MKRVNVKPTITLAGVALAVLGFYAPWAGHPRQIAALSYNALDLAEFGKFVTRAGGGNITREYLLIPIIAAALALALWAGRPGLRLPARSALTLAAGLLALVPLPPYPYLLQAYSSAEDKGLFVLSLAGVLCVVIAFVLGRRLVGRWRAAAFTVIALAGALPAAYEFLTHAAPAISAIYASPVAVGQGLFLTIAGFALVAVGGWIDV